MRYYFHVADGHVGRDVDGEDHPTDQSAVDAALDVLAEMLPGQRQQLWSTRRFSVAVKDATGRLIAVLTTTATVDLDRAGDAPPTM